MRNTSITNTEIDFLYEQRGEVDCDKMVEVKPCSWKDMQRTATRVAMERRAMLDAQKLINEEND